MGVDQLYPRHRRAGENLHSTPAPGSSNTTTTSVTTPNSSVQSSAQTSNITRPTDDQQGSASLPDIFTSSGALPTTITTLIPITTVISPSTTFTSFSPSIINAAPIPSDESTSSEIPLPRITGPISQEDGGTLVPTCVGQGFDAAATGVLTALIVPGLLGIALWITFAMLRPRFRQVYALREWFVQESLRSAPLGSGFFAWLFPPVPLIPPVPEDVSEAGRSTGKDAKLFPSDEQLSQRALFVALIIAIGWSVLALGGALPLYLIKTPCNSQVPSPAIYGGGYSTLLDLSLLRLLRLIDDEEISIVNASKLSRRALEDDTFKSRTRIIILTVLAIVLGVLPALWKIIREFNNLVAYRQRWIQVKCDNQDMAWLSAKKAPGFAYWGEKQFKDYLVSIGLSSQLGNAGRKRTNSRKHRTRRRGEEEPLKEDLPEVDIQCLFSITDTESLALKLFDREEILENLEIAETKYISSFRVTTPDPSILDFNPAPPPDPNRPYISRPLPLGPQRRSTPKRAVNRAYGASSFVAPSSFYKLRGLRGVSGGRFTDSVIDQTLGDSIQSRVIGSRFMEVNRNSQTYGRLPLGVHVGMERDGELGPVSETGSWLPAIPDPRYYGPNYAPFEDEAVDEHGVRYTAYDAGMSSPIPEQTEEEWVDLIKENPTHEFGSDHNGTPPSSHTRRPRPPPKDYASSSRRETFPLRPKDPTNHPEHIPPPHLRLQPQQPYVLPLDGVNYDDLGEVYSDINSWRVQLKNINAEIAELQERKYQDIANGETVKGWLMIGRNLRFIPGMELIEGRAKEDIRWDVLQNERNGLDSMVLWAIIIVTMALLAAGLSAASGLSLALAPDVAHCLSFLNGLFDAHPIVAGIATVFAPAVAATLFIAIALYVINWAARMHGSVSISGNQLLVFKITFFALAFIGTVWLAAIGALLYSMRALSTADQETKSLANGTIYMSVLALTLVINVAIVMPACLLLQPLRLWRVLRTEKDSVTPRQRFRATFPRTYNPSYAMGACILAIVFASTFALIFPLIAPAVVVFLLLTLIAHRYLVGYVYVRTHSQTGGVLQIWLLKRFGTLLSFQPILLGLIFMSRNIWIEGGVLAGVGVSVIIFVESYCAWKTRLPGYRSLSQNTRNSVDQFSSAADNYLNREEEKAPSSTDSNGHPNGSDGTTTYVNHDTRRTGLSSRAPGMRTRGSFASVLEIMSQTVAVVPSSSIYQGAVPLDTENLNDLTATERAARTHPEAPPRLPPLPFTEHADEMSGILYAPELISPPPIIWLPNDSAGVARSEAEDLQKYHGLQVTLDVRAREDVLLRRSISSRRRS